jgi:dihydropyrimidinase
MLDLAIQGGQVVTPRGAGRWDLGVVVERIALVAVPGTLPAAARAIDATGKIVVPGGVEPHTHLAHFIARRPEEGLFTLGPEEDTRGMVFGGTTRPAATSGPRRGWGSSTARASSGAGCRSSGSRR